MTKGWSLDKSRWPTPPHVPRLSGSFYTSHIETTTTVLTVTKDILYAVPFFVPVKQIYTSMAIRVTTFAAGNGRLGLYRDASGVPGALVIDAGTVSTATTNGLKVTAAFVQTLTVGRYWAAIDFDTSATIGVESCVAATSLGFLGYTAGTDVTRHPGWSVAFAYAALPDPFQAGGALMTATLPRVLVGV